MSLISEEILAAWLELSNAINNEKIVSQMPFNEILIYRYLYQHRDMEVTATDLCNALKMMKSQMNRTLTAMEEKQLISRERSKKDKRRIFVSLTQENIALYENEHARILTIVDKVIDRIGMGNAQKALEIFKLIAHIAKEEIQ